VPQPIDASIEALGVGPEVSIVIPVYNSARFLDRCLRSVLAQDDLALDIIAVDDASTDDSGRLLSAAAIADSRVRVVTLGENVGQGFARNRGIDEARGRYVAFLDSDDAMAPRSLTTMVGVAEVDQADIVFGSFDQYREQWEGQLLIDPRPPNRPAVPLRATNIVAHPELATLSACWQGLYRRAFLCAHKLTVKRRHNEDFDFVLDSIVHASTVSLWPGTYVWHIVRRFETDQARSTTQRPLQSADLDLLLDHFKRLDEILATGSAVHAASELVQARHLIMRRYLRRFACEILPALATQYELGARRAYYAEIAAIFARNSDAFDDSHQVDPQSALVHELLREGLDDAIDEIAEHGGIGERTAAEILISHPGLRSVFSDAIERRPAIVIRVPASIPAMVPAGVRRTILHIGAPRAGSTYIQNFLERNRANLLVNGILYPRTGIFRETGARSFRTSGHEALVQCLKDRDVQILHDYRREIEAAGTLDTIVFSAENLFASSPTGIDLLARTLANTRTSVVVYLRRQDEWAESMYVEWTTGGHWRTTSSFAGFLRDQEAAGILNYADIVERWANRFGRENIVVRPFSQPARNPAHDFVEACEIGILANPIEPEAACANLFFGDRADVEIIRFFNRLGFDSHEHYVEFLDQYYLWRIARDEPPSRPAYLGPGERRQLLARYADCNARIARDFLGARGGDLFSTAMTGEAAADPRIESSFLDQAFAFYHNSQVTAERLALDTELSKRVAAPEILAFGPNPVMHDRPFNQQPNGASAIWVRTSPAPSFGDTLVLGSTRLRTFHNRDVLTAEVPTRLFLAPSTLPLLLEYHRNGQRFRSKPVDFRVE
jgi:hypothetical protein